MTDERVAQVLAELDAKRANTEAKIDELMEQLAVANGYRTAKWEEDAR